MEGSTIVINARDKRNDITCRTNNQTQIARIIADRLENPRKSVESAFILAGLALHRFPQLGNLLAALRLGSIGIEVDFAAEKSLQDLKCPAT